MLDDAAVFSQNQLITVSVASNYAGTGFGSAGPGVLDTGGIGSLAEAVKKFILTVSVAQIFAGPVGSTLTVVLQDSPDNVTWTTTDLSGVVSENLTSLQIPGQVLLKGPLPIYGGGTNPAVKLNRYLRVYYTVGGGPFTAGALNSFLDTY